MLESRGIFRHARVLKLLRIIPFEESFYPQYISNSWQEVTQGIKPPQIDWSPEEIEILTEMFPQQEPVAILQRLPIRSWSSIKQKASSMHIQRDYRNEHSTLQPYKNHCMQDELYAQAYRLDLTSEDPQWGMCIGTERQQTLPVRRSKAAFRRSAV